MHQKLRFRFATVFSGTHLNQNKASQEDDTRSSNLEDMLSFTKLGTVIQLFDDYAGITTFDDFCHIFQQLNSELLEEVAGDWRIFLKTEVNIFD